jgi:large subunit ribosomal protein L10
MRKEEKTALVAEITEGLGRASIAMVSEYRGMTAGEATEVRRKLRAVRGELRVAKNTLIRRAIKDSAFSQLDSQLGGPVALILSFADPVELAKTVTGMRELGEKFKVRGGVLDGKPLSSEEIQALAALPPREVILAQLLGLLMAPATQLVRLLNEPGSALARVVDAIGKKNGDAAPAAGSPAPAAAAPTEAAPTEAAPTDAASSDAAPSGAAPSESRGAGGFETEKLDKVES